MRTKLTIIFLSLILMTSVTFGLQSLDELNLLCYADTSQELVQEEGEESSDDGLRITIVEDTPAEDLIMDSDTPLADGPGKTGDCPTHALLMGLFLILSVAFSRYFLKYDRKLFDLRTRIAETEQKVRLKERNQR